MQPELIQDTAKDVRHRTDPDLRAEVVPGSIVVGVDGSAGSVDALKWAMEEAGRRKLSIDAVLIREDATPEGRPDRVSATQAQQRLLARLDTAVEKARETAGSPAALIHTHVFSADPADVLIQLGARSTMLVVGSRGCGALKGALLGSVSHRCVQKAEGVTVVVRGSRRIRAERAPREVVVGVDGSPVAEAALQWAATVGTEPGDHLTLAHAWGSHGIGMEDEEVAAELTALGRDLLGSTALGLSDCGRTVSQALDYGPAEAMLARCSTEADLLVVGSRGRGNLGALLLGSVSLYCVGHAACPVAVVRPCRAAALV